jgi:murein DD-endopeptidase MepM/ murein hydrolase activator NlpD
MLKKKWIVIISLCMAIGLAGCNTKSPDQEHPTDTEQGQNNNEEGNDEVNNEEEEVTEVGLPTTPDEFIQRFLNNDFEFIYGHTTKEFQEQVSLNSLIKLGTPFNEGVTGYHLEAEVPVETGKKYIWVDDQRTKAVSIVLDENQVIAGLWILPITTYPESDQIYTKTEYILPFKGEWFTFWGGTNEVVNYHYVTEAQRYAFDFIILKDGKSYQGDKEVNENYYAFGQEVIAPADGTVVEVENEQEDNVPGEMDPFNPAGNYVILDHGNGEYSLLAHFKQGSILVQPGDVVKQGDVLGLVGNSGNSSEPHIHFQVMDAPSLNDGKSINIKFKGIKDPITQGDFVKNP